MLAEIRLQVEPAGTGGRQVRRRLVDLVDEVLKPRLVGRARVGEIELIDFLQRIEYIAPIDRSSPVTTWRW